MHLQLDINVELRQEFTKYNVFTTRQPSAMLSEKRNWKWGGVQVKWADRMPAIFKWTSYTKIALKEPKLPETLRGGENITSEWKKKKSTKILSSNQY